MIWAQSLFLLLLALASTFDLKSRHVSNELILTGFCVSAAWTWILSSGAMAPWPTGTRTGIALTLPLYALEGSSALALLRQWA